MLEDLEKALSPVKHRVPRSEVAPVVDRYEVLRKLEHYMESTRYFGELVVKVHGRTWRMGVDSSFKGPKARSKRGKSIPQGDVPSEVLARMLYDMQKRVRDSNELVKEAIELQPGKSLEQGLDGMSGVDILRGVLHSAETQLTKEVGRNLALPVDASLSLVFHDTIEGSKIQLSLSVTSTTMRVAIGTVRTPSNVKDLRELVLTVKHVDELTAYARSVFKLVKLA